MAVDNGAWRLTPATLVLGRYAYTLLYDDYTAVWYVRCQDEHNNHQLTHGPMTRIAGIAFIEKRVQREEEKR